MTGRIPKVAVVGGTYVDMVIRCGQVPSPGQCVAGSAIFGSDDYRATIDTMRSNIAKARG